MNLRTIDITNINFTFNTKTTIINDISFSLKKGDVFAILGASGSGKSTILRLLSDILGNKGGNTLDGAISIFGKTPKEYRLSGKLSFMFQSANLMPNLTVRQNIEFPLKLRKEEIVKTEIEELLETVGLKKYEHYYPKELSGGMKTRVALARSFVTKPELLLLDEPFSALDVAWRFELYEYLEKVKEKYNTTVILVSHDIQEAILLSNNIFVLSTKGAKIEDISINKGNQIKVFDYKNTNEFLEKNQNHFYNIQSTILRDGSRDRTEEKMDLI